MKKFRLINNITGWAIFLLATLVYLLTLEPTASFWDCGEFIASAFKLEVGHPPGNPVFMLIQNLFSKFAGGDLGKVAIWINSWSAIASGLCIMFLFWTITHLAAKIRLKTDEDFTFMNILIITGSGIIGALAYAFTDTFWFSAVEGEVYATSSLIIAFVFWAMLKWEEQADKRGANRWLILIAYLMGLSIGVHLLNLLAIPAMVLIFYFRKYKATRRGVIIALVISAAILLFIMYGIIPGVVTFAFWSELLFVNGFGLPYNSGMFIFIVLLIAFLIWAIRYTIRKNMMLTNTAVVMLTVMLIGYSSYALIMIRSSADPPMDQNNPGTLNNLLYYLSRKQYGQTPLISGQVYNAPLIDIKQGAPVYSREGGKYKVVSHNPIYKFDPAFVTFFPRMYSQDPRHVDGYKRWGAIKGEPIRRTNPSGKQETLYRPTFGENLRYFFNYQVGFMYWRYFMWNFAGRQNDIQGNGDRLYGNWLSGVNFVDEARLGPQDNLPQNMRDNRGRNRYYFLPLILGLVGLFYHARKHPKDFSVILLLFFMTGLAIVLYLNQKPLEPRERDYAYVGSFYAFAIWIGLGLMALIDAVPKKLPRPVIAVVIFLICLVAVPGVLAWENWDDHDRSGRYTCRDFAMNYLNSCAPDAVIFTNGDNDTFPLWYVQEVENVRTDVRVVNLSYLGADWYIEQMTRKAYNSDPLRFSMTRDQYITGKRDVVYLVDQVKQPVALKDAMEFVTSDDPRTKEKGNNGEPVAYIPAKGFYLPVDKEQVIKTSTVRKPYIGGIVPVMSWSMNRNLLTKSDLMMLDLLAYNDWTRPIYIAVTVGRENYLDLDNYFQLEGLSYRIVPVSTPGEYPRLGYVDTDILYDNMMNKFRWGNITDPKVYLDENNTRMLTNFRSNFGRLAEALVAEGKIDSARKALDKCVELLPQERVPHNYFSLPIVELYFKLNQPEQGKKIVQEIASMAISELGYFNRLNRRFPSEADYEKRLDYYYLMQLRNLAEHYDQKDLLAELENNLNKLLPEAK